MKSLFKSIGIFIKSIFAKQVVIEFNGEQEILAAQSQVADAISMFDVAAKNVEAANEHLDQTIIGVTQQMDELVKKMSYAEATKTKAQSALNKNSKIITKLKEFTCD